jgi:primosomal protein N''
MSDTERIRELERKLAEANHQIEKYADEARQAIEAYETMFEVRDELLQGQIDRLAAALERLEEQYIDGPIWD